MPNKTSWEHGIEYFKCNKCGSVIHNNEEHSLLVTGHDHVSDITEDGRSVYCGRYMPMYHQPNQLSLLEDV